MLYTEFLDIVKDTIDREDVQKHPFPHLCFKIEYDTLDINSNTLQKLNTASGREIWNFKIGDDSIIGEKLFHIGESIKNKLNVILPSPRTEEEILQHTNYSELWHDTPELDIQEIHLDFLLKNKMVVDGIPFHSLDINNETQTVLSMHIYIPDDDTHEHLGTSLYSEPSFEKLSDIFKKSYLFKSLDSQNPMDILTTNCDYPITIKGIVERHYERFMIKEKTIPYKPGYVFIHKTTPNSWHSAPVVPKGYIRKSIMTRWDWSLLTPVK